MEPDSATKGTRNGTDRTSAPGSTRPEVSPSSQDGADRLESWKAISAFIERDGRTAMRWAKEQGMPVHRSPGHKKGRVFASRNEISNWRLGNLGADNRSPAEALALLDEGPSAESATAGASESKMSGDSRRVNRHRWLTAVGAMFGFVAIAGSVLDKTAPGEPATCEVVVDTLVVKDSEGQEVWRRVFGGHLNSDFYAARLSPCKYIDLDGDGIADVLFAAKPRTSDLDSDTLYGVITPMRILRRLGAFVTPGTRTFVPGAPLIVGPSSDLQGEKPYDDYVPPYTIHGIYPQRLGNGQVRIVVSSGASQAPDQVAVLDSGLRKISEYWHTGALSLDSLRRMTGATGYSSAA